MLSVTRDFHECWLFMGLSCSAIQCFQSGGGITVCEVARARLL